MGSLYIGGAQCVHASFADEDDWEIYDQLEKDMTVLAKKYNVSISRYALNEDGVYSYVVMNKKANHECFYEGAAFDYDMSVEVSDTFKQRALDFVKDLESDERFSVFHKLEWSEPKVLYFVVS